MAAAGSGSKSPPIVEDPVKQVAVHDLVVHDYFLFPRPADVAHGANEQHQVNHVGLQRGIGVLCANVSRRLRPVKVTFEGVAAERQVNRLGVAPGLTLTTQVIDETQQFALVSLQCCCAVLVVAAVATVH